MSFVFSLNPLSQCSGLSIVAPWIWWVFGAKEMGPGVVLGVNQRKEVRSCRMSQAEMYYGPYPARWRRIPDPAPYLEGRVSPSLAPCLQPFSDAVVRHVEL